MKWFCVIVQELLLIVSLCWNHIHADKVRGWHRDEFANYYIVHPVVYNGDNLIDSTEKHEGVGHHNTDLSVRIRTDEIDYVLDVRLKNDLLSDNHKLIISDNGQHEQYLEAIEVCQYQGNIRGRKKSWVAISTCDGIRGSFYDGATLYHIENGGDKKLNSTHYLYNHNHHQAKDHQCGNKNVHTNFNVTDLPDFHKLLTRRKRSTEDTIFGPFNANFGSRYVELALVVDYLQYVAQDGNIRNIHNSCKDLANLINAVYAPLNIFIVLVGVMVWKDPKLNDMVSENGDRTLDNFLAYRREVLLMHIPNDNAHLLTAVRFNNTVVGKALTSTMCSYESSGGIATNHSNTIGIVAMTIAHEMGHNFGMDHDNEDECVCEEKKCIMHMASTSDIPSTRWSSCSMQALALSFKRGLDYCLRNKPKVIVDSPTCGNGFVEPSEQCDCGPNHAGTKCTRCCDPNTCMLRSNSTCATGACCDFDTCSPQSPGTVCRAIANGECDLPEYCDGHSEHCPKDIHKMNGISCKGGEAYCADGDCQTHTDQCKLLWGLSGKQSLRKCYDYNLNGNIGGNCGYNYVTKEYTRCFQADILCGLLQCQHLNEKIEIGAEFLTKQNSNYCNTNGVLVPCRTVLVDLGLDQKNPGLAPDGAKCGDNKMCYNQTCKDISEVFASVAKLKNSVCPSNCSNHGVCNSLGECHCELGFGPPLCEGPGYGGSFSSGPATDPTIHYRFMVAMYVIFLGIIPTLAICTFLYHYSKRNALCWWFNPKKTKSPAKDSLQRRISRSASKFAANFTSSHPQNHSVQPVATSFNADEMSSSLLRADSDPSSPPANLNSTVEFFGNFKGFSLTPLDKNSNTEANNVNGQQKMNGQETPKPIRAAPPVPEPPKSPQKSSDVKSSNSHVQSRSKMLIVNEKSEESKPSTTIPRPTISGPILEASTCSAKELMSPLHKTLAPHRAAPVAPSVDSKRPSTGIHEAPSKPLPEEPGMKTHLSKITSFLKHEKTRSPVARSLSFPKNPKMKPVVVDKTALRNLRISNPILQKDIDVPSGLVPVVSESVENDTRLALQRTQSMRVAPLAKPELLTFGSMRATRPTGPPPPKPKTDIFYVNAPLKVEYEDCQSETRAPLANINEESSDNIYAVIEESHIHPEKTIPASVPDGYNVPRPVETFSGSNESVGLLGEIVSEIEHRNTESIYSTSTLARKKKETKGGDESDGYYEQSNCSTTSSGYLTPASLNIPVEAAKNVQPISATITAPFPSPTLKEATKIPKFSRQTTPPKLRTVVPSAKNSNKLNKQTVPTASPDLVSSCSVSSNITAVKSPDVVNSYAKKPSTVSKPGSKLEESGKPPIKPAMERKPSLPKMSNSKPNVVSKPSIVPKPVGNRSFVKVDPKVKTVLESIGANKNVPDNVQKNESNVAAKPNTNKITKNPSTVAALQQKFENRKSIGK